MADIDKQELRKLAESQAQEPWFEQGQVRYHCKRTGEAHRIHHDDDAFIVAASPATVLALLDEIKTLEGLYHMHRQTEERQMIELRAEVVALRKDAELYRALRSMHWHDSPLAVVRNPKAAIRPGHDCPSGDRLDEAIAAAMDKGGCADG